MKIVEFWTGTRQEQQDIKRADEAKTSLIDPNISTYHEKKSRKAIEKGAQASHTRNIRRVGVVAALAVSGVLIGLGISKMDVVGSALAGTNTNVTPTPNAEQYSQALSRAKADVEVNSNLISRVDQGMNNLYTVLLSKATTPSQIGELSEPIIFYKANTANPDRNSSQAILQDLERRGPAAVNQPQLVIPNNDSFFYIAPFRRANSVHANFEAAFSILSKTLEINQNFDPENLYDDLIAYHESEHARGDAILRKTLRNQGKLDSYIFDLSRLSGNSIIGFYSESDAFLKQIALLDLISNGQLTRDLQTSIPPTNKYATLLHTRPEQNKSLTDLLGVAWMAKQTGAKPGGQNFSFAESINQNYASDGFDIYDIKDGKLVLALKHS